MTTARLGIFHTMEFIIRKKTGKTRVVFDWSAKFQETSLNDHLLTGPDLTNMLVGVLCRFRKGSIAVMCDVERMFHQFHVKKEDQDYLRFLWWEYGNLKKTTPSTYRMSTIILPPPGQFIKEDLQKRWRRVRWKKEYLLSLQPRQK